MSVGAMDFEDAAGQEQVGAYAPVATVGGAVVIVQPRVEAYAAAYRMRFQAIVVLVVFALLALIVSWWTARQMALPILDLTRGAESVAKGDFNVEVRIESDDELRDLAETFNYMTRQLKKYAELQVDRQITYAGSVPHEELPRYLNKARAFLFTTTGGVGKVSLEAMACGIPLIITSPDARDFFGDRLSRWFLTDPSLGSIAEGIHRILEADEETIDTLSRCEVDLIRSKYRMTQLMDRIVNIMHEHPEHP